KSYEFEALSETGLAKTILALQKLPVFGTVFMVGAHPDDEDNGLIAHLAKNLHLNSYYLVATWGEGGQNVIGPELYDALGVLRSQELASAREIDGGEQLHFGAYDFGYSKTAEETFNDPNWDEETIIGNLVRLIRIYKPIIVLGRHAPTGGHGHHQACGVLVPKAVEAAGDPNMYPEQLEEGLQV
ncbi:PIG-L deacetylase family protein, partial [Mesotoga sp. HF07.pep.5.2.highcov]